MTSSVAVANLPGNTWSILTQQVSDHKPLCFHAPDGLGSVFHDIGPVDWHRADRFRRRRYVHDVQVGRRDIFR